MKTRFFSLALVFLVTCFALTVLADDATGDYIKVEVKGTLETGIMAIGGETTGTIIRANNVTWELDLKADKTLLELATKLNKKSVTVTGTYEKKTGMAVKERNIIKVETLKAAN